MFSTFLIRTRPEGAPSERFRVDVPQFTRAGQDTLADMASDLGVGPGIVFNEALLMELSARQPYDANHGNIDVYKPGRWDTSSNLIFMDTIRQVGPSPGEWDGSASYIEFTPPSNGTYLIVGNFTGYQTTAHLIGPWGENTGYTAQTSDSGVVVALYATDQQFQFNLNFTAPNNGYGLGYIESIQVFSM
jgi:hypothetical protein